MARIIVKDTTDLPEVSQQPKFWDLGFAWTKGDTVWKDGSLVTANSDIVSGTVFVLDNDTKAPGTWKTALGGASGAGADVEYWVKDKVYNAGTVVLSPADGKKYKANDKFEIVDSTIDPSINVGQQGKTWLPDENQFVTLKAGRDITAEQAVGFGWDSTYKNLVAKPYGEISTSPDQRNISEKSASLIPTTDIYNNTDVKFDVWAYNMIAPYGDQAVASVWNAYFDKDAKIRFMLAGPAASAPVREFVSNYVSLVGPSILSPVGLDGVLIGAKNSTTDTNAYVQFVRSNATTGGQAQANTANANHVIPVALSTTKAIVFKVNTAGSTNVDMQTATLGGTITAPQITLDGNNVLLGANVVAAPVVGQQHTIRALNLSNNRVALFMVNPSNEVVMYIVKYTTAGNTLAVTDTKNFGVCSAYTVTMYDAAADMIYFVNESTSGTQLNHRFLLVGSDDKVDTSKLYITQGGVYAKYGAQAGALSATMVNKNLIQVYGWPSTANNTAKLPRAQITVPVHSGCRTLVTDVTYTMDAATKGAAVGAGICMALLHTCRLPNGEQVLIQPELGSGAYKWQLKNYAPNIAGSSAIGSEEDFVGIAYKAALTGENTKVLVSGKFKFAGWSLTDDAETHRYLNLDASLTPSFLKAGLSDTKSIGRNIGKGVFQLFDDLSSSEQTEKLKALNVTSNLSVNGVQIDKFTQSAGNSTNTLNETGKFGASILSYSNNSRYMKGTLVYRNDLVWKAKDFIDNTGTSFTEALWEYQFGQQDSEWADVDYSANFGNIKQFDPLVVDFIRADGTIVVKKAITNIDLGPSISGITQKDGFIPDFVQGGVATNGFAYPHFANGDKIYNCTTWVKTNFTPMINGLNVEYTILYGADKWADGTGSVNNRVVSFSANDDMVGYTTTGHTTVNIHSICWVGNSVIASGFYNSWTSSGYIYIWKFAANGTTVWTFSFQMGQGNNGITLALYGGSVHEIQSNMCLYTMWNYTGSGQVAACLIGFTNLSSNDATAPVLTVSQITSRGVNGEMQQIQGHAGFRVCVARLGTSNRFCMVALDNLTQNYRSYTINATTQSITISSPYVVFNQATGNTGMPAIAYVGEYGATPQSVVIFGVVHYSGNVNVEFGNDTNGHTAPAFYVLYCGTSGAPLPIAPPSGNAQIVFDPMEANGARIVLANTPYKWQQDDLSNGGFLHLQNPRGVQMQMASVPNSDCFMFTWFTANNNAFVYMLRLDSASGTPVATQAGNSIRPQCDGNFFDPYFMHKAVSGTAHYGMDPDNTRLTNNMIALSNRIVIWYINGNANGGVRRRVYTINKSTTMDVTQMNVVGFADKDYVADTKSVRMLVNGTLTQTGPSIISPLLIAANIGKYAVFDLSTGAYRAISGMPKIGECTIIGKIVAVGKAKVNCFEYPATKSNYTEFTCATGGAVQTNSRTAMINWKTHSGVASDTGLALNRNDLWRQQNGPITVNPQFVNTIRQPYAKRYKISVRYLSQANGSVHIDKLILNISGRRWQWKDAPQTTNGNNGCGHPTVISIASTQGTSGAYVNAEFIVDLDCRHFNTIQVESNPDFVRATYNPAFVNLRFELMDVAPFNTKNGLPGSSITGDPIGIYVVNP